MLLHCSNYFFRFLICIFFCSSTSTGKNDIGYGSFEQTWKGFIEQKKILSYVITVWSSVWLQMMQLVGLLCGWVKDSLVFASKERETTKESVSIWHLNRQVHHSSPFDLTDEKGISAVKHWLSLYILNEEYSLGQKLEIKPELLYSPLGPLEMQIIELYTFIWNLTCSLFYTEVILVSSKLCRKRNWEDYNIEWRFVLMLPGKNIRFDSSNNSFWYFLIPDLPIFCVHLK